MWPVENPLAARPEHSAILSGDVAGESDETGSQMSPPPGSQMSPPTLPPSEILHGEHDGRWSTSATRVKTMNEKREDSVASMKREIDEPRRAHESRLDEGSF
jgi:hypothetical protein